MSLRLHFLGSPRIERDGRFIETDTRKAVALLAYLALTRSYQTREVLAALLWPEMNEERARAGLRRTLSALRAAVGDEALHVTRDGLSLNETQVWCDAVAFKTGVSAVLHAAQRDDCTDCLPRMEETVALYRDPFLSGFSLRDSAEFDDWQTAETEYLRRTYSTALSWLVETYGRLGNYERAIELGRRWLAVDPLREEAHRRLMQLYAWNGARDAALRQYREAVRILDDELGIGPLPETTALYEAIQEAPLARPDKARRPPSLATTPEAKTTPAGPPLIGREAAWRALMEAYEAVSTSGRLIVVTGETGTGKTHLVSTFIEHVRTQGAVAAAATCYEGESGLAYAPVAAGLRALIRQPSAAEQLPSIPPDILSEAARLVPEMAERAAQLPAREVSATGAQARFFAGIGGVLAHLIAGTATGVFFLDDLQWADDASLDLLAYLSRRLGELPFLLILSWVDSPGNAPSENQRLRRLLVETQRAGTGRLIQLPRWRPSDVLALVMSDERWRPRAGELADRLYRETEGLPYFVIEYLAALDESAAEWAIPQSVRDLLAGRLDEVDQTSRQLLQTAAVIGRSFNYTTLLDASGRSEEEVVGGLERLLAQGLIRELDATPFDDVRYDFAHQQMRSLVYEETNLARRRLLHRRVAAALGARARGTQADAAAGLIAEHYHLGGQDEIAADFYRRAGSHARALFANHEALSHFRTALALGHPDTAALHEAIGDLHTQLAEYQAALQAYESAAAQAVPDHMGRLEHKLGQVYERRGNWELAESHYCAALDEFRRHDQPAELARLNVDRSRVVYRSGNVDLARSLAREALALAEVTADPIAEAQAHNTLGILARQTGDVATARDHLERSLALSEVAGSSAARVAALNNLARLLESDGYTTEALGLIDQALALCTREGDRHHEAALLNHRADILHRGGEEDASMTSLKKAIAIYAEIGVESGDWQPEIWKLTEW